MILLSYNTMSKFLPHLRTLAIIGNIAYFFWIIYNGIDEGFQSATPVQIVAYLGFLVLCVLNVVLLTNNKG